MFSKIKIDINCDMGEGIGSEVLLMPYVSSCNIACGAHAGDVKTIDEVIRLAKLQKVKIGAHPSFPDKENFGRQLMNISDNELQNSIESQIRLLLERVSLQEERLHHVKLHGALYNLTARDKKTAKIVVKAIKNVIQNVVLFVPYKSCIAEIAKEKGFTIAYEAFADRNYNDDLSLVSRSLFNAVISDKEEVLNHVLRIVKSKKVKTITKQERSIEADTLCIHGDHKNSVTILSFIYNELSKKGIKIG